MTGTIKSAINSGHGTAVLYGLGIGLVLSDVIPTIGDAAFFKIERNLRDKWKRGEITPQRYWSREAAAYYLINPVYWSLVLGAMVLTKGDFSQKAKVGLAIIGAGAVIGVLYGNVKKDLAGIEAEKNQEIPKKV